MFQVQYYKDQITYYDDVVTIDEAVYRATRYSKLYEDRAWIYQYQPGSKTPGIFRGSARCGFFSWAKDSCAACSSKGIDGKLPCPKCEGGSWRP